MYLGRLVIQTNSFYINLLSWEGVFSRIVLTSMLEYTFFFFQEYLQGNPLWLQYVKVPLVTLGYESSYDVFVKAEGGGLSGQAQAISLGIARALLKVSDDHRSPLKKEGLLTRDSRVVERKKAGLKKARKAPQFSKRWGESFSVASFPTLFVQPRCFLVLSLLSNVAFKHFSIWNPSRSPHMH